MSQKVALLCVDVAALRFHAKILGALNVAFKHAEQNQVLVHMYSTSDAAGLCDDSFSKRPSLSKLLSCSSLIYASASKHVPGLNVTVLQRYFNYNMKEHRPAKEVNFLLVEGQKTDSLVDVVKKHYNLSHDYQVLDYDSVKDLSPSTTFIEDIDEQMYDYCALGGTFDNIHNGHKMLLGAAIARTNKTLTIGVTDQSMNLNKTLCELISPIEERKAALKSYVEEVRPDIEYDIVTLTDGYGPTITDEKLQCIVVSEETKRGADMINEKRTLKGYPLMTMVCVPLVEDDSPSKHQDEKVSSSTLRERKLGQLLRQPEPRPQLPKRPYLIGLTGGIASGKSSVGKRLERLGAGLVSSDLLAHAAYKKGSEAYNQVIEAFGGDIVNTDNGEIERRKLGAVVFGNKSKLDQLNGIVWPATAKLVQEKVAELFKQGKEICYIEAALLLEANWSSQLHEVWSCIIPEKEAVKRLHDRNGLEEEEALRRIKSQASNQFRVDKSNVVLCTLWDYEVTQKQVEKAWGLLQERLESQAGDS